ncbi:non-ribosomal peptide synthetase [Streptomyces sedi]|uniref:Amino acid adenylation domain-containing protein n=1 Tax=Streptomyces sedi TaxID=555059 RepID=A0A5C4UQH5_9ACTN|nr:non-ribosomal peptide synthetase [Streptomyces sedi]TNM25860.1 amino acid adenylation domain-containing protein [Streptomyces sedi]
MSEPFSREEANCLVLLNDEGQYSLWPAHREVPEGWTTVFRGGVRAATAFTDDHWSPVCGRRTAGKPLPPEGDVVGAVEREAQRRPEATAVLDRSGSLTYAALNDRANRLAHHLIRGGIGPGTRVAVALPPSHRVIVALLAVLKAGGAYVPLDPSHPTGRLRDILADARPHLLLTIDETTRNGLPLPEGLPVHDVDGLLAGSGSGADPVARDLNALLLPSHPAYTIFTSGSTGRPKGVIVPRTALANLLADMTERFALGHDDRLLSPTTVSFDIAALELFLPLLAGASVVVAGTEERSDPHALAELLISSGTSLMQATPSLWRMLMDTRPEALRGLRVLTGGEALPADLARRLVDVAAEVDNLYGPTETTIWSTCRRVSAGQVSGIGAPIRHTHAYVLDEKLATVPDGVEGDLYLAGEGLADGYLGRPGLTARQFIADPYGPAGTRMYHTGDRASRNADATLDYHGRTDQQIKIRGHRVEAGEIEAALERHPAVAQAVVVPVNSAGATGQDLAALLVGLSEDSSERAADQDLRSFLADVVPDAWVPRRYVWCDRLPFGGTGKLDRNAARATVVDALARVPASGGEENSDVLRSLWDAALGAPDTGGTFLSQGGHSLAAARVIGGVWERLGVRVPMSLFVKEDASLRELRAYVTGAEHEPTAVREGTGPLAAPRPRHRDLMPLPASLRRLWYLRQLYPEARAAYHVVAAAQLPGEPDPTRLDQAVRALIARHDALRIEVRDEGDVPELYRVPAPDTARTVEICDLDGDWRPEQFAAQSIALPSPDEAPLMRVRVARGNGRWCLVLVLDHMIADQRAADTLLADLVSDQESVGASASLPAPRSFWEFLEAGSAESGARAHADLKYWREELDDAPAELLLPMAAERPAEPDFRPVTHTVRVVPAQARGIASAAASLGVTPTAFHLGCFATLLHSWSGRDDLVIGLPADARRTSAEQDMVGMALDTLVVRSRTETKATVADVIRRCRDGYAAAADHTAVPFDSVVEALERPAVPGLNPVFQAWFNDLGDLKSPPEALPVPVTSALFDLAVYLRGDGEGQSVTVVGAAALFSERLVGEFARQYLLLLERAAADPDIRVDGLSLREPGPSPSLPECVDTGRFWERLTDFAHARDSDTAVLGPQATVTYGELRERVRGLAAGLAREGAGRGRTVALWSRTTENLPETLLALWRTGATVALIPEEAPVRYREQCADAVSADLGLALRYSAEAGVRSVTDIAHGPGNESHWPEPGGTSHLLFTSGTTGTPAAVAAPPDALGDAVAWYLKEFRVGPEDRFAMLSGPAHDPVLRDILVPLSAGATLCVPQTGFARRPEALFSWLDTNAVTVVHVTPGLLELIASGASGRLDALRLIVVGGDVSTEQLLKRIRGFTDAAVVNAYGATETPQIAACQEVLAYGDQAPAIARVRPLPVGRRAAGREIHVAGPEGLPLGPGQFGEVVVRGRALAHGYAGDVSRAERFDVDPFGEPGVRLYRTGDHGYTTLDGDVVVTGRFDRQVSLDGHRVELAEVEAVAQRFPGVVSARAAYRADGVVSEISLAVRAEAGQHVDVASLRTHLRGRLPRHAVPSVLSAGSDELRLDASRKVRQAPSAPSTGDPGREARTTTARLTPVTKTADELQRLVAELLGHRVPDERNFFDAGLTSLALLRLHRGITQRLGFELPATTLFAHPTVKALAKLLDTTAGPGRATPPETVAAAHDGAPGRESRQPGRNER